MTTQPTIEFINGPLDGLVLDHSPDALPSDGDELILDTGPGIMAVYVYRGGKYRWRKSWRVHPGDKP